MQYRQKGKTIVRYITNLLLIHKNNSFKRSKRELNKKKKQKYKKYKK
jgi:hypothetical protein